MQRDPRDNIERIASGRPVTDEADEQRLADELMFARYEALAKDTGTDAKALMRLADEQKPCPAGEHLNLSKCHIDQCRVHAHGPDNPGCPGRGYSYSGDPSGGTTLHLTPEHWASIADGRTVYPSDLTNPEREEEYRSAGLCSPDDRGTDPVRRWRPDRLPGDWITGTPAPPKKTQQAKCVVCEEEGYKGIWFWATRRSAKYCDEHRGARQRGYQRRHKVSR